ncbi:MAG: ELWxxDGT repeat protein [Gaiellaceae bacterium]
MRARPIRSNEIRRNAPERTRRAFTRATTIRLLTATATVALAGAFLCGALAPRGEAAATISAQLVADITPGAGGSYPSHLAAIGGSLYFSARDSVHQTELWTSNGTEAGTAMVKDINTNPYGSGSPGGFTTLGSSVYFGATDGSGVGNHGGELWKSDGTPDGTVMVADINPGIGDSNLWALTTLGAGLYFFAEDGVHGSELWKSDGVVGGTTEIVKDINPGYDYPDDLTVFNGNLYFRASDGSAAHGYELWKSDGTPGGTAMVKDINPGGGDGLGTYYTDLTDFNGSLYFQADDGVNGIELWKSDGVVGGTTEMVKDINPGSATSFPYGLTAIGGSLYFEATDDSHGNELWKSDGVVGGTTEIVKDINPGSGDSNPGFFTTLGGDFYFIATDGSSGYELWKSNGTPGGTAMVKDINPGGDGSYPGDFTVFNGDLYFEATDGTHGVELWKSNGTGTGTVMVQDINPGSGDSVPFELTALGSDLYFRATDGSHGYELWRAGDFSPPETQIDSGPSGATGDSNPTFTFSADEASTFQCALDGAAMSACTSPKALIGLADGAHTFQVQATDLVGNIDASPAARSFTVDTTAPETQIGSGPSGFTRTKSATFTFSSPETSVVFECKLDSTAWAACSSPKSYTGLSDGAHTFNVRAKDLVGNIDASPAKRSFTVDTHAPQTKIAKHPKKVVSTEKATTKVIFTFTSSEKSSRFACKLDKKTWKSCSSRTTYKVKPGKHTLLVRATDRAGNTDRTPAKWVWKVKRG